MPKPINTGPPAGSNFLTYVTVSVVSLGVLGFMYLLFGELFFIAMLVFAVVGGVGCLHYFTWGKAMTEEGKKEGMEEFEPPANRTPSD